jgi:Ca-activated chloride channel family protein
MNAEAAAILRSVDGVAVPLERVSARGHLRGALFELVVEQSYLNSSAHNIEAVYTFPVPLNAVFLGLELELNGVTHRAQVLTQQAAARRYEDALGDGHTAVLLEQASDGLYTASLGNLMAGERARIRYRYAELVAPMQGTLRLAIPTVIAPRYGNADRSVAPHQAPGFDVGAEYPFALAVTIEGPFASAALSCPTHPISVEAGQGCLHAVLARGATLDGDFILQLAMPEGTVLSATEPDGAGCVALASLEPDLPVAPAGAAAPERAIALKLLIDCSGSMGGDSIEQARRALQAVIEGLGPEDRVSITRFGSNVEDLTDGLVPASPRTCLQLRHTIAAIEADMGGTALPQALARVTAAPDRGAAVLLITDGEVWAIDDAVQAVADSGHRLFVVGVGAAPVEALARRVAEVTRGACEFVTPEEDIVAAIVRMAGRIRAPFNQIVDIQWPQPPLWAIPPVSAVFAGDTVHLLAGFAEPPRGAATVTLQGEGGIRTRIEVPLAAPVTAPPRSPSPAVSSLARVAASLRLRSLATASAIALAERYQIASAHTSFVLVAERSSGSTAVTLPRLAPVPQMLTRSGGLASFSACHESINVLEMRSTVSFIDRIELDLAPLPRSYAGLSAAGFPHDLIHTIARLADGEGVPEAEAVALWLGVILSLHAPERLDALDAGQARAALADRRWRQLRVEFRLLAGDLPLRIAF